MSVRDDIRANKFLPDVKQFPYGDPQSKIEQGQLSEQWALHRTEVRRLTLVFKAAALIEVGLDKLPQAKQDKAWEMAWDRGHASGLEEVLNELEELAELLA